MPETFRPMVQEKAEVARPGRGAFDDAEIQGLGFAQPAPFMTLVVEPDQGQRQVRQIDPPVDKHGQAVAVQQPGYAFRSGAVVMVAQNAPDAVRNAGQGP